MPESDPLEDEAPTRLGEIVEAVERGKWQAVVAVDSMAARAQQIGPEKAEKPSSFIVSRASQARNMPKARSVTATGNSIRHRRA